jgi:hypothetical protein
MDETDGNHVALTLEEIELRYYQNLMLDMVLKPNPFPFAVVPVPQPITFDISCRISEEEQKQVLAALQAANLPEDLVKRLTEGNYDRS